MPWPIAQDYVEAIREPSTCFADTELQRGTVVVNAEGLPVSRAGDSSQVFAIRAGNRTWAIKCFTRPLANLPERYAEIMRYLRHVQLPCMVECTFTPQGIRVHGEWYPVVKMPWVNGATLYTFVRDNLDRPAVLQMLAQTWVRVATRLHEANLAHGDLQHGNVLLVPESNTGGVAVNLVDYDGMCVPGLEHLAALGRGHDSYQHPQRLREGTFAVHIDRFPHLVIYTALRALSIGGRGLWDKFDNGDNLLFTQKDFEAPGQSPIFQALLQLNDPEVRHLAQVVARATHLPISSVPLLDSVLAGVPKTPVKAPVAPLEAAAKAGDAPQARQRQRKAWIALALGGGVAAVALIAAASMLLSNKPSTAPTANERVAQAKITTGASSRGTHAVTPTTGTKRTNSTSPQTTAKKVPPPPVELKKDLEARKEPEPKKDVEPKKEVEAKKEAEPKKEPGAQPKTDPLALVITSCPEKVTITAGGEASVEVAYQNPANLPGRISFSWGIPSGLLVTGMNSDAGAKKFTLTIKADPQIPAGAKPSRIWVYLEGSQRSNAPREFTIEVKRPEGQPAAATAVERRRYDGAGLGPWALAGTSDGRHVFATGTDRRLHQWEIESGRQVRTFDGTFISVQGLGLSADNRRLVTVEAKQPLRVWDTETGTEVAKLEERNVNRAIIDAKGHRVVFQDGTGPKSSLHCWDLESKRVQRIDAPGVMIYTFTFLPNDRQLLTVYSDGTARVWDLEKFALVRTYQVPTAARAALSSDGRLAVFACNDKSLQLWDLVEGRKLKSLDGLLCPQHHLAISRDGSRAVSIGVERLIHVWDLASGRVTVVIADYSGPIPTDVAFTPKADQLLVSAADNTLRLWDLGLPPSPAVERPPVMIEATAVVQKPPAPEVKPPPPVEEVAPDGPAMVVAKELRQFVGHTARVNSVAVSADGKLALTGSDDRSVRLWDTATGQELFSFANVSAEARAVALSGDGKYAIAACKNQILGWEIESRKRVVARGFGSTPIESITFLPDHERLLVGQSAGSLWLLPLQAGVRATAFAREDQGAIHAVAVSADGRVGIVGGSDGLVQLYDLTSRREQGRLVGSKDDVLSVALTRDASQAVTAGADKLIRIWDSQTAKVIRTLSGHQGRVTSLSLSPDGRRIVTGSDDKTVRVWDVKTGKELWRLTGHSDAVTSVAFAPEGRQVWSAGADKTVRLWELSR
jgi:WD40 repeat protein